MADRLSILWTEEKRLVRESIKLIKLEGFCLITDNSSAQICVWKWSRICSHRLHLGRGGNSSDKQPDGQDDP